MSKRIKGLPPLPATRGGAWTPKAIAKAEKILPDLYGTTHAEANVRKIMTEKTAWACQLAQELASTVGRGYLGAATLQQIKAAAYAAGWAEVFFREAALESTREGGPGGNRTTRLVELGSKLADASRLQLTSAMQMASTQAALMAADTEDVLTPFLEEMKKEAEKISETVDVDSILGKEE